MKIRIISTPPGIVAPEEIRKQWVGIEIPLAKNIEQRGSTWIGQENIGGYEVYTAEAIKALHDAQRHDAAEFWEDIEFHLGEKLRFKKECCVIV